MGINDLCDYFLILVVENIVDFVRKIEMEFNVEVILLELVLRLDNVLNDVVKVVNKCFLKYCN